MDWDEKPKPTMKIAVGDALDTLSLADLESRVAALTAEIERVKAEVAKKKAHNAAAASIFKS